MTEQEVRIALFGKDETEGIIDVVPKGDNKVTVYRRTPEIVAEEAEYHPFFFLSDIQLLRDYPRERYKFQKLKGDNYYQYLVVVEDLWDAVRHVESVVGSKRPREIYTVSSPVQMYLYQTGRTCFKGMTFDDLHRMQLDIETYSSTGQFPNAERPGDRIIIVSLSDNRGWSEVIHLRQFGEWDTDEAEKALLEKLVAVVTERNPDVLETHNGYGYDYPYIMARCERLGVPFRIGRDGSVPTTKKGSVRFAERTIDYTAVYVAGRQLIDTMFQAMALDVIKRDMPGHGLKVLAKYFGVAAADRTYVEGSDISLAWRTDPERLLKYALDDVYETRAIAERLSGATFYLTQMLPFTYQSVSVVGSGQKIESLFLREYLRQRYSYPIASEGKQKFGGLSEVFVTGVVGPIVYADVESLYPSIMLNFDVSPKEKDPLQLFSTFLSSLTKMRLEAKYAMKGLEKDDPVRSRLDAQQGSYKTLINSFYGTLSFSLFPFNNISEADRVAKTGQQIALKMKSLIEERGGKVIELDTDGALFTPPKDVVGEEAERAFVDALTKEMPKGIVIGFDGRFKKMLSYKAKNYVLLGYDGKVKIKGSSFVSRSTEKFGRDFVRECVKALLESDFDKMHDLYMEYRDKIMHRKWESVDDFVRTVSIKDSLDVYKEKVEMGQNKRAEYELALELRESGFPVKKGDRISMYITGFDPSVTAFEKARRAADWNHDENTAYYLMRLDQFAEKFRPFFNEYDYKAIFSEPDIFGFDGSRIKTLITTDGPFC